mmetsp:Transcript_22837/g.64640  ORF Transcript_22837/g.64640 Transcript_22837/m.64640 type:complete len:221 (-) Transcript_22837:856-1518(-)
MERRPAAERYCWRYARTGCCQFFRIHTRLVQTLQYVGMATGQQRSNGSIEIGTAQSVVAVASHDIAKSVTDMQYANVERSSAKVVHQNLFDAVLLVQPVRQGGGCRFLENSCHRDPGVFECLHGPLPLQGVELCWHCQHRRLDVVMAQEFVCDFDEVIHDVRSHILRRNRNVVNLERNLLRCCHDFGTALFLVVLGWLRDDGVLHFVFQVVHGRILVIPS